MKFERARFVIAFVLGLGCGPTATDEEPLAPDANAGCELDVEVNCFDGVDDDCDGLFDCNDVLDCAASCGGGGCGEDDDCDEDCGEANFAGDPLAIPDGLGIPYETSLTIAGFTLGQLLEDGDGILAVCMVMEHSWIRDLQMELTCPSGQTVILNQFLGQTGGEVFLGEPYELDEGMDPPIPGVGWEYCWSMSAANPPMLDYANAYFPGTLPAGDYQPSQAFSALEGCELNGTWTLRAIDLWPIDNGVVFEWGVKFDQGLIEDCDDWVVD